MFIFLAALKNERVSNLITVLFSRLHDCIQDCFPLPATCAQRLQLMRLVNEQDTACSLHLCFNKSEMLLMNTLAAIAIMFTAVNIFDNPMILIPAILDFA